ncbi:C-type lectin domain family 17, member A-like [Oryzias melastigma]|uniref:C-type lectin domain family 17, member A-like n=1 Tax=Oryzias melastigma TaxID=30732 RepID=UPI000CF83ABA|nr:C-type lectin domain family 17, member A-like [Oryzias melastigma]
MTRYLLLSLENIKMKISYNQLQAKLSDINKTLLDEINQQKNRTEGKSCPEGWMRFRNRCYYKSTEKKTWFDSRIFCQDKGSDLLVINSKEEQEFVSEMNQNDESWIGVVAQWSEKITIKWKWVDGSPVLQQFWENGFPKSSFSYFGAVAVNAEGKWTQQLYLHDLHWICEK